MVRIRKTRYFDRFKLKKMISFLSSDEINHYTKVFMNFPLNTLHDSLPMKFKFLPESYVLVEQNEIIGMITVSPIPGNPYKISISRLYLEQNYYNAGKQLIEYIIAKYGAKGVHSFIVAVDDSYGELLSLFIDGCAFRQCSSEQLWKMESVRISKADNVFIRPFKNSDAQAVAMLFNDALISHFKPSVSKTKQEYVDTLFQGLKDSYTLKFVIEEPDLKTLKTYFSLSSTDEQNYVIDITSSAWYQCPWDAILSYSISQISRRRKSFNLFVRVRNYVNQSDEFKEYLSQKGFACSQTQQVLVKDFYKLLKEPQASQKIVLFSDVVEKPVFKV